MTNEQFKVTDLESANWAFRKLSKIKQKEDEVKSLADKERERISWELKKIEEWEANELKEFENDKSYFVGLLNTYYIEQKEQDSKFKLKTPFGKVTSRKGSVSWKPKDNAALVEELKQRGFNDFIKIDEKVLIADIKKQFQLTDDGQVIDPNGEVLDLIEVVQGDTTYKVEVE